MPRKATARASGKKIAVAGAPAGACGERASDADPKAPEPAETSAAADNVRETESPDLRADALTILKKLIHKFEVTVDADKVKPTVGDFLRLLQAHKELEGEQPKEITVEWVDPSKKQNTDDK